MPPEPDGQKVAMPDYETEMLSRKEAARKLGWHGVFGDTPPMPRALEVGSERVCKEHGLRVCWSFYGQSWGHWMDNSRCRKETPPTPKEEWR